MTFNHTRNTRHRSGFTLIELITAMAITAILVIVIMQLTNQGIALWKVIREDTSSSANARLALQTISRDLESYQVRTTTSNYQWFFSEVDSAIKGMPKGLGIPKSARCIFFVCAPDRNPAVSSTPSLRTSYREVRAGDPKSQGDVSAVAYRLMFRDQILNLPGRSGDPEIFPLFSLYRQVVSPRDTYDHMLGKTDLKSTYSQFESDEEKHFLCENVVEMNLIFNVEYSDENTAGNNDTTTFRAISIPILSSSAGDSKRRFELFSRYAQTEGRQMENARIVSAQISITVLTEEGVALVEQVRLGQRRAPKLEEFFSRYTRSYSRSVALPLPL